MALVTAAFLLSGEWFVSFFTTGGAISIILPNDSIRLCFFGIGMILINKFTGAGDT